MTNTPKRPPTDNMMRVLYDMARGRSAFYDCSGPGAEGGRSKVLSALCDRGFLNSFWVITDAGVLALAEHLKRKEST